MFIFIHHGEKSRNNDCSLSDIGVVRCNNLPDFFTKKKNPNINTPKRIITTSNQKNIQTVNVLAKQLSINIESEDNYNNIINRMKNDKSNDILFCGNGTDILHIVERLIYKLYYKEMHLRWNKNPELNYDSINDYSSIWVLDTNDNTLKVYNYFDVLYNRQYDYYDINYSRVSVLPLYTCQLKDNNLSRTGALINNIKGFLYNMVT